MNKWMERVTMNQCISTSKVVTEMAAMTPYAPSPFAKRASHLSLARVSINSSMALKADTPPSRATSSPPMATRRRTETTATAAQYR